MKILVLSAMVACVPIEASALTVAVLDGEPCPAFVVEVDNRAAFQCALDRKLLDLRGAPGRYYVDTPPWPRPYAVLSMPDDAVLIGDGVETITWRGDPAGAAWRGIQPHNRNRITGVTLELIDTTGEWDEQSHLVELVGPLVGFELDHVKFIYPVASGVSRGDCIRIRCYPETRCWDVHVHHSKFESCPRSGVAVHSGLHGHRLANGTCSTRFNHSEFIAIADQDFDGEGSGDIGGISDADCVEWDHNVHRTSALALTSLAISLYPGSVEVHHNLLDGRGLDILGGSHRVHHNVITQRVATGAPVVFERKAGSSWFHDETWTRDTSAGAGAIFAAEQKLSAPSNIRLDDVRMVQHTARGAISAHGVAGITMRNVTIVDDGPAAATRDAIHVEGSNAQPDGTPGVRASPVVLLDSVVFGPFRALLSTTGYYAAGAGAFDVRDNIAPAMTSGLRCEDAAATATTGGISGPVMYMDNVAGAPMCSVWTTP